MRMAKVTNSFTSEAMAGNSLPAQFHRRLVVVGCSSAGTANVLSSKSSGSAITSAAGEGPLPRFAKRALAILKQPVLLVKATTAAAGSCGDTRFATSLTAAESATPDNCGTVTFSGAAYDSAEYLATITVGGAIGTAKYKLSDDNGRTLSEERVSAASVAIPNANVTMAFSVENGNFVAGHTFRCRTAMPTMDVAGLEAALEAINSQQTYQPGIVAVIQGWDEATIDEALQAVHAAAFTGESLMNIYTVLLNSREQAVDESADEYRSAFEAVDITGSLNPKACKVYGEGIVRDEQLRTRPNRLNVEEFALKCVQREWWQEMMEKSVGRATTIVSTDHSISPDGDQIYQNGWVCLRQWPSESNLFFAASLMDAAPASQMVFLPYRQAVDQCVAAWLRYGQNFPGQFSAETVGGVLTDEAAAKLAEKFENHVSRLFNDTLLGAACNFSESSVIDNTLQLVLNYEITVAAVIGEVVFKGTMAIGN